ncbi:tyrosine-protein phosphatase [Pelotomaculum propionicicum]|uniref:protein-tyrosine-phosphatase n=1 Tax=Pelotomaculum propionicicum TaxID=258475 RepID=A0A4Y7RUU5_9FIRM|nr:CpsB/CapC family capsule biosynthesis tyrosine phosphatase [Pelotomaculum propionicicum]NLI11428.1 phosphotransferase [Peptococcaceae bacterium]TEB12509.1 Tyrosine-protein phosphatase YwqE [Pelotomaculum propionicicum]
MIDIHSHILPGLDDGAASMDEAIAMARCAVMGGIRQMVATPHVKTRLYPSREAIMDVMTNLQKALMNNGISLIILPGAEYRIDPELPKRFSRGELLTINNKGRYLLVELPDGYVPDYTSNVFQELQQQGVTPIIAHPERNNVFIRDHSRLYELIADGALAQLTAGSLTGYFCPDVTVAARAFLEHGSVHFIASDAHSTSGQLPQFEPAAKEAVRLLGEEKGHRLLIANPQRAIRGEFIEVGELKKKVI